MSGKPSLPRFENSHKTSLLGLLLLTHFAVVCIVKITQDASEELLWLSHVALLVAGLGMVFRSSLMVQTSLTGILVLHEVWLYDCVILLASGTSPMGITAYLSSADGWSWLATLHHFYLAPLLIVLFVRQRIYPRETPLLAAALFLYLTLLSRGMFSAETNVNYAFGVLSAWDVSWLNRFNTLPGFGYLIGLNLFVSIFCFLPTALILRRFATAGETMQLGKAKG